MARQRGFFRGTLDGFFTPGRGGGRPPTGGRGVYGRAGKKGGKGKKRDGGGKPGKAVTAARAVKDAQNAIASGTGLVTPSARPDKQEENRQTPTEREKAGFSMLLEGTKPSQSAWQPCL